MKKNEIIDFVLQLPLPAAHFNPSGEVVCLNNAFTKLLGYTKAEIPTVESHWELFFPDVAYREKVQNDWIAMLEESAKTGMPIQPMLLDIVALNGEVKKLEVHSLQVGTLAITMWIDFTERLKNEDEVQRQLAEKNILLHETHHRIKNNFTTIESLLSLQANSLTNPEALTALQHAIGRVKGMRMLYDRLLLGDNYKTTSVKDYLNNLIDEIVSLYSNNQNLTIEKHLDDVQIDSKRLFPIGIIVNEVITNITKYAFKDRDSGLIEVTFKEDGREISLVIQDNGKGLPEGFDIDSQKGFGFMLIKMLSKQLGGSFIIEGDIGTRSILKFPI